MFSFHTDQRPSWKVPTRTAFPAGIVDKKLQFPDTFFTPPLFRPPAFAKATAWQAVPGTP